MGIPAASDWISTGWAGNFPATTNSEPRIYIRKNLKNSFKKTKKLWNKIGYQNLGNKYENW